jgi:hypothetical protein
VERTLGLMCGAGVLPARLAREAKRRGFRVVAFAFGDAPGLESAADRVIASTVDDIGAVLDGLRAERVSAALFGGKFWTRELLQVSGDPAGHSLVARGGGGVSEAELMRGVLATFTALDIEILDPRPFFGDWISSGGSIGRREPTGEERRDIERGLQVARQLAAVGVGQTVVVRRGLCLAVEASEGTTETVRRGLALAGPGGVVVKAVVPEHDYRFDVPSVGPETLCVMAAGRAGALAIEAGRVLILERDRAIEIADGAGIAVVSVPLGTGDGARG